MNTIPQREIGSTGTTVSQLGLGTAPLGDLFHVLEEDSAQEVLKAAWEVGVRYYDTSPFYGNGKSEHRLGHFLRQKPRDEFVLSTKVGRVFRPVHNLAAFEPGPFAGALPFEFTVDYSYDGIMRSFEDSLQRLSLPSVDLVVIHDLDFYFYETEARVNAYLNQLFTSGWRALDELRRHGLVKGVGAGINELGMIPRFLDLVDLDFFLVAYGYNLLTQEMLDVEFRLCEERGISVIIGAVFASGILATGAGAGRNVFLRAGFGRNTAKNRAHRADMQPTRDTAGECSAAVPIGKPGCLGHHTGRDRSRPYTGELRNASGSDTGWVVE